MNADALDLSLALGLDKRIAPRCLQAGVGLGGNFVESDIASLTALAQRKGVELRMLSAAQTVSQEHAQRTMRKIAEVIPTSAGQAGRVAGPVGEAAYQFPGGLGLGCAGAATGGMRRGGARL